MVKLTGSIVPQGFVAYLLPLNCPCTSSLLTLCNKLLTYSYEKLTENRDPKQSGKAERGTKKVSDATPECRLMGGWKRGSATLLRFHESFSITAL